VFINDRAKLYYKRDDFNVSIVSNIPAASAYRVCIYELIISLHVQVIISNVLWSPLWLG